MKLDKSANIACLFVMSQSKASSHIVIVSGDDALI